MCAYRVSGKTTVTTEGKTKKKLLTDSRGCELENESKKEVRKRLSQ